MQIHLSLSLLSLSLSITSIHHCVTVIVSVTLPTGPLAAQLLSFLLPSVRVCQLRKVDNFYSFFFFSSFTWSFTFFLGKRWPTFFFGHLHLHLSNLIYFYTVLHWTLNIINSRHHLHSITSLYNQTHYILKKRVSESETTTELPFSSVITCTFNFLLLLLLFSWQQRDSLLPVILLFTCLENLSVTKTLTHSSTASVIQCSVICVNCFKI